MVVAVVSAIGSRRGGGDDIANTNSVAIAPFENRGGSTELTEAATALASYLTDAVSGVDSVRIFRVRGTTRGSPLPERSSRSAATARSSALVWSISIPMTCFEYSHPRGYQSPSRWLHSTGSEAG